jgi:16S rRNA G966 N2-methylase RsmD
MVFDAIRAQALLTQMAEVLRQTGHQAWISTFDRMIAGLTSNPDAARTRILDLFAGAGSLNVLVLHSHVKSLVAENDAFGLLRTELYELCRR